MKQIESKNVFAENNANVIDINEVFKIIEKFNSTRPVLDGDLAKLNNFWSKEALEYKGDFTQKINEGFKIFKNVLDKKLEKIGVEKNEREELLLPYKSNKEIEEKHKEDDNQNIGIFLKNVLKGNDYGAGLLGQQGRDMRDQAKNNVINAMLGTIDYISFLEKNNNSRRIINHGYFMNSRIGMALSYHFPY